MSNEYDNLSREELIKKIRDLEDSINIENIFDVSPSGMVLENLNGIILSVNNRICQMTGYSKEELIGQNIRILLPKDIEYEADENIKRMIGGEELFHESKNVMKDGEIKYFEIRERLIGKDKIIAISNDVTEKYLAEEKLWESETKYRKLYEMIRMMADNVPDLIWAKDLDGKYIFVNKAVCEILLNAKDTDEPIGKDDVFFTERERNSHPENKEWHTFGEICINSDLVVQKNKIQSKFDEFGNVRGKFLSLDVYKAPFLNEKGEMIGTVGSGRVNINEKYIQKENERIMKELALAKASAEEMNKLKSNFLSNMSHELRTPMNGILGFSFIIKEEAVDENIQEMGSMIYLNGKRLMDTLNLILDLSRIESGKSEYKFQFIDVGKLSENIYKLFDSKVRLKGLEFNYFEKDTGLISRLDEKIFYEILSKLLDNAVKYTKEGYISIEVSKESEQDCDWSVVKIIDTGIGISKENLELIFDEFRQVSEGFSRTFEGSGLGLTIAKKFTEAMGGKITVESRYEIGSIFKVKFPIKPLINSGGIPAIVNSQTEKIKIDVDKSKKILVVDDDLPSRKLIETFIGKYYSLVFARTAAEAIETAKEGGFSLVLMDINLGRDMSGIDVVKIIKQYEGFEEIPIIAVTAFAMLGDKEEFIKAGCTHYISKPF